MAIVAYQPFKALYSLGAVAFELTCLPLWLIQHLTVYGRGHPSWTYRQSLTMALFFKFIKHMAIVQVKTPLPLTPGAEKERFVVIKSKKDEVEKFFRGPLVGNQDVKPQDVGATWYPAPLSKGSDLSNVVVDLHIHGGAFVVGDGRTEATGFLAGRLLKHTAATHVIAPQYRLSTLPASKTSNPFPASLQDSLTTYLYLLHELKVPAKNIILSGDSAGGNNAIALIRYLAEYGRDVSLPSPSAALLISPWINPSDPSDDFIHTNPNYGTDYLAHPFIAWGSTAYAGLGGPTSLHHGYAALNGRPFKTEVPMWVNAGSTELLYFDDKEWAEMMIKEGNQVVFDLEEGAPHDVWLLGATLGFVGAADRCAKRAGEWLQEVRK
jgi:acetyl esterase/lipase